LFLKEEWRQMEFVANHTSIALKQTTPLGAVPHNTQTKDYR